MNRTIKLSMLLLVQVGLAFFLLNKEEPTATFKGTEALLSEKLNSANKLIIKGPKGNDANVELVKTGEQWTIPTYHQFPASQQKINDLTTSLTSLKRSWPAGKTPIAAKQFKVDVESYEREMSFYDGETLVHTIYLGSSPSFKKLHIRVDQEDLTYSVPLSLFEFPTDAKEWQDAGYLSQSRAQIKKLTTNHFSFENSEGDFVVVDPGEGQETDKAKTSAFMTKLASPQFDRVLGNKSNIDLGPEKMSYTLELEDGSSQTFTYYQAKESESPVKGDDPSSESKNTNLILVSSLHPYGFEVSSSRVSVLLNSVKAQFVKAQGEAEPESSDVNAKKSLDTPGEDANASNENSSDIDSMADAIRAMNEEES